MTDRHQHPTLLVEVDIGLCRQHGVCMFAAPQVFVDLSDDGSVTVVQDAEGQYTEEIINAASSCPTQALRVKEAWR